MATTTPTRTVRSAAGAVALLIGVLTLSSGLGSPVAAATHDVLIKQYAYTPDTMSISQGDTITWTNQDTVEHDVTVTAGPATFHSPMLGKGESWSHTFATAGSYSYICSIHPDMKATVTVRPRAVTPTTPAPAPAPAHHSAAAPASTTGPTASASTPSRSRPSRATAAVPAAQAAAVPQTSQDLTSTTARRATTLDPLLLVAGFSAAVMVFCLLMLSSRPAAAEADTESTPGGA